MLKLISFGSEGIFCFYIIMYMDKVGYRWESFGCGVKDVFSLKFGYFKLVG